MFKKIFPIIIIIMLISGVIFAADYTHNASPITVVLSGTTTYKSVEFPFPSRNLHIWNLDAQDNVWVDLTSSSNTGLLSTCYLLGAGKDLNLYDYVTGGISIIKDTTYTGGVDASPISVIVTY